MFEKCSDNDALDDVWFYGELKKLSSRKDLADYMFTWPKDSTDLEPRWRNLSEKLWSEVPEKKEWRKLLRCLPEYFSWEVSYLADKMLDFSRYVFPYFDTILANHAYFEWLLYAELDYEEYRDHIVHPFKVAMVSKWLLDCVPNARQNVMEQLKKADHVRRLLNHMKLSRSVLEGREGERIVNAALWFASLFHDLGYGHHFACCLERRVQTSYSFYRGDIVGGSVAGVHPDFIERSLLKHHLDAGSRCDAVNCGTWRHYNHPPAKEIWQAALYESIPLNHSMAGGVNLLCLLQEIIDDWPDIDPRLVLVFELAAEAIFLHDLTGEKNHRLPDLKITFNQSPLAVILILADEIQAWGRPKISHRRGYDEHEVITRFDPRKNEVRYEWGPETDDVRILSIDFDVWRKLHEVQTNLKCKPWKGFIRLRTFKTPPAK